MQGAREAAGLSQSSRLVEPTVKKEEKRERRREGREGGGMEERDSKEGADREG
jgi:hypothetical protein